MNPRRPWPSKRAMRILGPFAPLALLLAATAAPADEAPSGPGPCATAAVEAVQSRYERVRDLRARFEQVSRPVGVGRAGAERTSRGRVVFAKPGRMRWSYEAPEPSLVVSDGEWLWIYDPERREAQKLAVGGGAMAGAAVQFLLGEGRILRDFEVRAEACDETGATLLLIPRRPEPYERLRLRVGLPGGALLESEVVDLLGNVTRVRFEDVEENVGPAPELFRFIAPEGVEVIEATPPGAPR